jgi:hypothetical protein
MKDGKGGPITPEELGELIQTELGIRLDPGAGPVSDADGQHTGTGRREGAAVPGIFGHTAFLRRSRRVHRSTTFCLNWLRAILL